MRIICCGDRNWTNREVIYNALKSLPKDTVVIHGANGVVGANGRVIRGADKMAAECALELNLKIDKSPTPKESYGGYPYRGEFGRAGGPIRNQQMLDEALPDEVWCFHNRLTNSKGSLDMIDRARKAGVPVKLFTESWPTGAWLEMNALPKDIQDELFAQAGNRFKQTFSYKEQAVVDTLRLPNHPGTCDCADCNTAYGKRK